jgi:nucleoside-diphosphate-sugar epimerase
MRGRDCLLLTGATGLIGRAAVRHLLRQQPARTVFALVRQPAQHEVLRALGVHPLPGDLTLPNLGIPLPDYSNLCENLTQILHIAADIRFDLSVEEARPVNVTGVKEILSLAGRSRNLVRLGHVSTAYVNGYREGVFAEEPMPPGQHFVNGYQQSKYEAEQLVVAAMREIPASIYRVPIVLADSSDGVVSQFGYFHRLLRMLPDSILPLMPGAPDLPVDLVSAEWTAAGLAWLFDFRFSPGSVRHLCAGAPGSLRFAEVAEVVCATMERHPSYPAGRSVRIPKLVPIADFDKFIAESTDQALRRVVSFLGPHVRLMGIRQEYRNEKAQAELEGSGLALPEARAFLAKTLDYCLDHRWGMKPS